MKKGILMKLFFAPTYFMIFISLRLAKTLALVVLEMMIRDLPTFIFVDNAAKNFLRFSLVKMSKRNLDFIS